MDFIYRLEITWNLKALLLFDNRVCERGIVFNLLRVLKIH